MVGVPLIYFFFQWSTGLFQYLMSAWSFEHALPSSLFYLFLFLLLQFLYSFGCNEISCFDKRVFCWKTHQEQIEKPVSKKILQQSILVCPVFLFHYSAFIICFSLGGWNYYQTYNWIMIFSWSFSPPHHQSFCHSDCFFILI